MKKILSYILLLAMALSLFAGCAPTEQGPDLTGLDKAKTYLFNLYKDSPVVTTSSYDVVGVVVIQGYGTYNVTWSSDCSDITFTTNGMIMDDELIDWLNKEMSNVVLSLDGRKEVNDHFRKDYTGKGSYDTIVPHFQRLVEKRGGKNYYVRGTFTHNNVDFTNDLLHMADLGFTELSMEPVVCPPGDPYALTEEDMPKLFEQYEILAKEMLKRKKEGNPFTFYHYMIDLKNGPCIYKRITGCGSGTEYMAVTPWGDLYPCHQFVGDEKYLLGNVWDGVKNTPVQDEFRACNAYARPACRDCWARMFCSGGCAANAYHATGSISGVYEYGCELFKKRIECAVMMKVAEAEEQ